MNDPAIFGMLGLLIGGVLGILITWTFVLRRFAEQEATNARLSDTVGQLQYKRDRALDCVTPKSAHVGKKMAAILKGEQ